MIRFLFPYNMNNHFLWYEEEDDNRGLDFCFNEGERERERERESEIWVLGFFTLMRH